MSVNNISIKKKKKKMKAKKLLKKKLHPDYGLEVGSLGGSGGDADVLSH